MNKNYWMTLVAKERSEQIIIHGHTIESDVERNSEEQLVKGAIALLSKPTSEEEMNALKPDGWDAEGWEKMTKKTYKERLIIATALLAAEIDRRIAIENQE